MSTQPFVTGLAVIDHRTLQPGQVRHSFRTNICPSGILVEVYRLGPLNHYLGFVCSSTLTICQH